MKYYKLLNPDMTSYGGCKWKIGEWKKATGDKSQPLCTDGWLHCYNHPLLAVLHNPIHAKIQNPRLFEVEVTGKCKCGPLKFGFRRMMIVKELSLSNVTTEQRIRYAILCGLEVCSEPKFVGWAKNWLSGVDRTEAAAMEAAYAAEAVEGAYAAVAVEAVEAACAAWAAWAAVEAAAGAVEGAAEAAAWAAWAAVEAANAKHKIDFDLVKLAERAVKCI